MYLVALEARQVGAPGGGPGGNSIKETSSQTASPTTETASPTPTHIPASHGSKIDLVIPIIAVLVGLTALILGFVVLRRTRIRHQNPRYVPTPFLKKAWQKWTPSPLHHKPPNNNEPLGPISRTPATDPPAPTAEVLVDRHTSVRSVMTLPAYRPTALTNEQVLGREGERAGIDMVIEFPEGADEEEERREEEMEALYQVRLARRRENEEREERRRLRREARARGDHAALRDLAARARETSAANAGQTVEELRAEHERIKRERQRAVSSVAYGLIGVARHDGTRIRANSIDVERQGLLSDAASMAASTHRRRRSTSSVPSVDSLDSELISPSLTRSRGNSGGESLGRPLTSHNSRTSIISETAEHEDVPPNSPPGYENISLATQQDALPRVPLEPPPGYQSPVEGRGEHHAMDFTASRSPVSPLSPDFPPTSVAISLDEGRDVSSSLEQLASERRFSSAEPSARGVGGVPRLPSLRMGGLPSIYVVPDSPRPGSSSGADIQSQ